MKYLFMPVGIVAGLVAGMLGKKAFEKLWAVIDEEDPPEPDQRDAPTAKLVAALAIEGAIFRLVKGMTDYGARRAFAGATGSWPGETRATD
ncbi:MAG TPA: DUF4235 domain-containing protein [Solirubrobacterales bacterium]|nr:DUF4235 domain-containing protein [Solirubrobacterales bacterium]